ncbi:hypothetical protein [Bdellovibrio sp. HCB2-146]|uniref:hypothetical protein n=1 Tax=Bdellovibrio sp. HCB2-146 TaxID=3394362 RepID=UPI0039BD6BE9
MAGLKTFVLSATISIALAIPTPVFADAALGSSKKGSSTSGGSRKKGEMDSTGAEKSGGNASGALSNIGNLFSGLFGGSNPAEDKAAATPVGLDDSNKIITELVRLIYQQDATFSVDNSKAVVAAYQKYASNWQNCIDKQASAATWCLETNNSDLQNALSSINMLASTSGLASVTDSCSTMGKIMNIGSAALTAYSAQCGLWRSACALSCVAARGGLETMKKLVPVSKCADSPMPPTTVRYNSCNGILNTGSAKQDLLARIDKELNLNLQTSIAKKTERCTTQYVALLGSAALGLANLKKAAGDSKSCEEDSDAGTQTASLTEKCADAANANLPECICLANPRTAGCSNGLSSVGEANAGQGQAVSPTIASGGDPGGVNLPGGDSASTMGENLASSSGDSGGGIGAPVGGGGSGLGGSTGGGGGGVGEKGGGGKAGLNTDILSGTGGGGGGGYGGYGGSEESGSGSGYRNYLPGGSKDPARGLAGQALTPKDVTGQAGKSNWEKVRDRYIDNKSTLLGN